MAMQATTIHMAGGCVVTIGNTWGHSTWCCSHRFIHGGRYSSTGNRWGRGMRFAPVASVVSTQLVGRGWRQRAVSLSLIILALLMHSAVKLYTSVPAAMGLQVLLPTPAATPRGRVLHLDAALAMLHRSQQRYVVADVQKGLGNRLRALASAMSVAAATERRLMLVWVPDFHCNCSFASLYRLPFDVVEMPVPLANLSAHAFQVYNYMNGEPGAIKQEPVDLDPSRHLYFRSAYVMNHAMGKWTSEGPQRCSRLL